MSNTTNTVLDPEVALDETEDTEIETVIEKPKKKKAGYRIISLILLAIAVVSIVLPIAVITASEGALVNGKKALYSVLLDVIKGNGTTSWYGIPVLTTTAPKALVYSLSQYFMIVCTVVGAIIALINVFAGKRCAARTSAGFLTAGFAFHFVALYALSANLGAAALDIILLACLGGSLLFYFILSAMSTKKAWYNLFQFVLSVAVLFALAFGFTKTGDGMATAYAVALNKYMILAASAIIALVTLIALIRLSAKKGFAFELVYFIFELIAAGVFAYLVFVKCKTELAGMKLFTIVAVGAAFVQFVISLIVVIARKKPKEEADEEEVAVDEPVVEPVEPEPAPVVVEPVAYDGGPIPVETAEIAAAEPVEPSAYDYYNSKAFDPFIASLTQEERNQFMEIFILKYKGSLPELPEYVVGGDNKVFFSRFFIYIGQLRERVPDGLLAKIYTHSTRL